MHKVTIIIRAGNKMSLIYRLFDLIYMIDRSISTIALDTDLVIKIYTYCILYMIKE